MNDVFERILVVETIRSNSDLVPRKKRFTTIPEDVDDTLMSILEKYGQTSLFYYSHLDENIFPSPPWALCFFDREYPVAGHFTSNNSSGSGVLFTPYRIHESTSSEFVPKIGVVLFSDKASAQKASAKSPLFELLWSKLNTLDAERYWLSISAIPENLVHNLSQNDAEEWFKNRKPPT